MNEGHVTVLVRVFLLGGLVFHKAVWETLKRRDRMAPRVVRTLTSQFLAAVKLGILCGMVVQTFLPDVFPIRQDPGRLRIFGILLYTAGLLVAVVARLQLGRNWSDIEKSAVGDDHALVSHGIYRYIRHPIYAGDLLLLAGFELALNSWLVLAVAALAAYVGQKAVHEEKVLKITVPGYEIYCRTTSRFIPFLL